MVYNTAKGASLHKELFKVQGAAISKPLCLSWACWVWLAWFDGRNDPSIKPCKWCRWIFSHTWTMYVYPSSLSFRKTFIIVSAHEWYCCEYQRENRIAIPAGSPLGSAGGCSSRFGWKQGGLEDALPYTWSSTRELLENIFSAHSRSFFLPQQLSQKEKGREVTKQVLWCCPPLLSRIKVGH